MAIRSMLTTGTQDALVVPRFLRSFQKYLPLRLPEFRSMGERIDQTGLIHAVISGLTSIIDFAGTVCLNSRRSGPNGRDEVLIEQATVISKCCSAPMSVTFNHREASALPPGHYRKNLTCPKCQKLVITDLIRKENDVEITQEVIDCG